jgi:hypothetical protein
MSYVCFLIKSIYRGKERKGKKENWLERRLVVMTDGKLRALRGLLFFANYTILQIVEREFPKLSLVDRCDVIFSDYLRVKSDHFLCFSHFYFFARITFSSAIAVNEISIN